MVLSRPAQCRESITPAGHQSRARGLAAFAAELETHEQPQPDVQAAICGCVGTLKSALKPEYREALERVEIEGVAVKDYAHEAGISANNASVRVHRARSALRREVARSCGSCAEHGCIDCTCRHAAGG